MIIILAINKNFNLHGLGKCKSCLTRILPGPGRMVPITDDITL